MRSPPATTTAPPRAGVTTLMIKPVGAACQRACTYCYSRAPASPRETIAAPLVDRALGWFATHAGREACVAWQGGEPLLAGAEHFQAALATLARVRRPGQRLTLALQTNGLGLDDAWCRLLVGHGFWVGLSLDGPAEVHEPLRGAGTHAPVLAALARLRAHGLEPNLLCTLQRDNVGDPDRLWRFFVDQRVRWLQLIPVVEWQAGEAPLLQPFVAPIDALGELWCRLFDLWFASSREQISVRLFDALLNRLVLGQSSECTLAPRCAAQLTLMPDGALYACDHFIAPTWQVGAVGPEEAAIDQARLDAFAARKTPGARCRGCAWVALCHGGCPKHRPALDAPSVLCGALRRLFVHAADRLAWLAARLRRRRAPTTEAHA